MDLVTTPMKENWPVANLLRNALITQAVQEKGVSLEPVPEDGIYTQLPTGDRVLRGQVRLLIKAVVDSKLADTYETEYVNDLRRVPWARNQTLALRAANRFLQISEWAEGESGEEAASSWENAALLPEWLSEDYNGWPHGRQSYVDLANSFFGALRSGGWNERIFLDLLDAIKTKED